MTSQTTIEFHGNMMKRRMAQEHGNVWQNPYNLGMRRNLEQVWGSLGVDHYSGIGSGGCCTRSMHVMGDYHNVRQDNCDGVTEGICNVNSNGGHYNNDDDNDVDDEDDDGKRKKRYRNSSCCFCSKWRRIAPSIIFRLKLCLSFFILLLPSTREPEFLPVPMKGETGKRWKQSNDFAEDLV